MAPIVSVSSGQIHTYPSIHNVHREAFNFPGSRIAEVKPHRHNTAAPLQYIMSVRAAVKTSRHAAWLRWRRRWRPTGPGPAPDQSRPVVLHCSIGPLQNHFRSQLIFLLFFHLFFFFIVRASLSFGFADNAPIMVNYRAVSSW